MRRLLCLGLFVSLLALAGRAEAQAPGRELRLDRLELALSESVALDGVRLIAATRAALTAVFETYCAAEFLIPPEGGYSTEDYVLGIGCLIGATTLYVTAARQFRRVRERPEARDRFRRFRAARRALAEGDAGGELLAEFEAELADAARLGRRDRWIGVGFGAFSLIGTAVLVGLGARGIIERNAAASIATGTASVGILSFATIWLESPAERASRRYRGQATSRTALRIDIGLGRANLRF